MDKKKRSIATQKKDSERKCGVRSSLKTRLSHHIAFGLSRTIAALACLMQCERKQTFIRQRGPESRASGHVPVGARVGIPHECALEPVRIVDARINAPSIIELMKGEGKETPKLIGALVPKEEIDGELLPQLTLSQASNRGMASLTFGLFSVDKEDWSYLHGYRAGVAMALAPLHHLTRDRGPLLLRIYGGAVVCLGRRGLFYQHCDTAWGKGGRCTALGRALLTLVVEGAPKASMERAVRHLRAAESKREVKSRWFTRNYAVISNAMCWHAAAWSLMLRRVDHAATELLGTLTRRQWRHWLGGGTSKFAPTVKESLNDSLTAFFKRGRTDAYLDGLGGNQWGEYPLTGPTPVSPEGQLAVYDLLRLPMQPVHTLDKPERLMRNLARWYAPSHETYCKTFGQDVKHEEVSAWRRMVRGCVMSHRREGRHKIPHFSPRRQWPPDVKSSATLLYRQTRGGARAEVQDLTIAWYLANGKDPPHAREENVTDLLKATTSHCDPLATFRAIVEAEGWRRDALLEVSEWFLSILENDLRSGLDGIAPEREGCKDRWFERFDALRQFWWGLTQTLLDGLCTSAPFAGATLNGRTKIGMALPLNYAAKLVQLGEHKTVVNDCGDSTKSTDDLRHSRQRAILQVMEEEVPTWWFPSPRIRSLMFRFGRLHCGAARVTSFVKQAPMSSFLLAPTTGCVAETAGDKIGEDVAENGADTGELEMDAMLASMGLPAVVHTHGSLNLPGRRQGVFLSEGTFRGMWAPYDAALIAAFKKGGVVIRAACGYGKSTRLILQLAEAGCRVVMTQPRSIAVVGVSSYINFLRQAASDYPRLTKLAAESKTPVVTHRAYGTPGCWKPGQPRGIIHVVTELYMRSFLTRRQDVNTVAVLDEIHEGSHTAQLNAALARKFGVCTLAMTASNVVDEFAAYMRLDKVVVSSPERSVAIHRDWGWSQIVSHLRALAEAESSYLATGDSVERYRRIMPELELAIEDDLATQVIFLCGRITPMDSIEAALRKSFPEDDDDLFVVISRVHGLLDHTKQQENCVPFRRSDADLQIILATSVVESSLTFACVDTLIDWELAPAQFADSIDGALSLVSAQVTDARLLQRMGRLARVKKRDGSYGGTYITTGFQKAKFVEPDLEFTGDLRTLGVDMLQYKLQPHDMWYKASPALWARAGLYARTYAAKTAHCRVGACLEARVLLSAVPECDRKFQVLALALAVNDDVFSIATRKSDPSMSEDEQEVLVDFQNAFKGGDLPWLLDNLTTSMVTSFTRKSRQRLIDWVRRLELVPLNATNDEVQDVINAKIAQEEKEIPCRREKEAIAFAFMHTLTDRKGRHVGDGRLRSYGECKVGIHASAGTMGGDYAFKIDVDEEIVDLVRSEIEARPTHWEVPLRGPYHHHIWSPRRPGQKASLIQVISDWVMPYQEIRCDSGRAYLHAYSDAYEAATSGEVPEGVGPNQRTTHCCPMSSRISFCMLRINSILCVDPAVRAEAVDAALRWDSKNLPDATRRLVEFYGESLRLATHQRVGYVPYGDDYETSGSDLAVATVRVARERNSMCTAHDKSRVRRCSVNYPPRGFFTTMGAIKRPGQGGTQFVSYPKMRSELRQSGQALVAYAPLPMKTPATWAVLSNDSLGVLPKVCWSAPAAAALPEVGFELGSAECDRLASVMTPMSVTDAFSLAQAVVRTQSDALPNDDEPSDEAKAHRDRLDDGKGIETSVAKNLTKEVMGYILWTVDSARQPPSTPSLMTAIVDSEKGRYRRHCGLAFVSDLARARDKLKRLAQKEASRDEPPRVRRF